MNYQPLYYFFLTILIISCDSTKKEAANHHTNPDIIVKGAMKNVMWKGELDGIINLDTIDNKSGLYGLGPESYLTGELLILDGEAYVSKVISDSTMKVEKTLDVSAPFFVYGNVNKWQEITLSNKTKTIKDLEDLIKEKAKGTQKPFCFKLKGQIANGLIHIQNLPKGTKVSSPTVAHQGQTNYILQNEEVDIIGFFSTKHQGIFTHHDSFLHMHLITKDRLKMGHLDKVTFQNMKLYLPF